MAWGTLGYTDWVHWSGCVRSRFQKLFCWRVFYVSMKKQMLSKWNSKDGPWSEPNPPESNGPDGPRLLLLWNSCRLPQPWRNFKSQKQTSGKWGNLPIIQIMEQQHYRCYSPSCHPAYSLQLEKCWNTSDNRHFFSWQISLCKSTLQ